MAAEPITADEHNTVRPDLGTTPVHPSAIDEHHDHAHDPTDQPCLSPITPPSMRHQTAMAAHSISSLIDTSACITSLVPKPPRLHWWTTIHQDPAFVPATIAPASATTRRIPPPISILPPSHSRHASVRHSSHRRLHHQPLLLRNPSRPSCGPLSLPPSPMSRRPIQAAPCDPTMARTRSSRPSIKIHDADHSSPCGN
ncbi:hypothetical protein ACLOJK_004106 [Asimina triloba]